MTRGEALLYSLTVECPTRRAALSQGALPLRPVWIHTHTFRRSYGR